MARAELQPGYLLHRRPYGNSSWTAEIFTADFGRVGLLVRGARRAKSPYRSLIQPFQPLLLSWSGRSELKTLTAAEDNGSPLALHKPPLFVSASYCNELLLRLLLREDPHPALYDHYVDALTALAQLDQAPLPSPNAAIEAALRRFELLLLEQIGYGLELTTTSQGEPVAIDQLYDYSPARGELSLATPLLARGEVRVSGQTLQALASLPLQAAALVEARIRREAKLLTRAAIALHLNDKPLQSRQLLQPRSRID